MAESLAIWDAIKIAMDSEEMLKERLKRVFPETRMSSIVARLERKDDDSGSIPDSTIDLGEELETFQPNVFGSEDRDTEEEDVALAHSNLILRIKTDADVASPVSALDVIVADERRSDLEFELSRKEINIEKLQRIASAGLPVGGSLRATAWKLLLGYLPSSRDLWEKVLTENRLQYTKLKEELLLSPSEFARRKGEPFSSNDQQPHAIAVRDPDGSLRRLEISQGDDHPLSSGKSSVWHKYFEYTEISEQIDRDLQRTHPDMKFFSGDTPLSRKHREAMRNILLLFAKLNPAIQYVQGMNEVLSPIYYVFCTDTNETNAANAEADSFACFVRLLSDSVDHFCQHLDNSAVGILSTLSRLSDLLKEYDEELWRHLEFTTKVKPQFYAFRWITLLLTQEFKFDIILRIWDSLMSNSFGVQDMLLRICCAMILCVKDRLLNGDFTSNVRLLQHYPDIDIERILEVARDLEPDASTYRLLVS